MTTDAASTTIEAASVAVVKLLLSVIASQLTGAAIQRSVIASERIERGNPGV
jgi:hypothetical protein